MMFESAKKWLSNVWIIQEASGICIFEQSFMNIDMSPDLISGFLIAMLNFGRELTEKDLKMISFNELRIKFKKSDDLIIAIAVLDNCNDTEAAALINLIAEEFKQRYVSLLEHFSGDTSQFDEFGLYTEKIIDKKALPIYFVR
ncbi:MAG: hypothetical protein GF364_11425, partial [Candidatus Lokiarchaeota archaeon]|nr:hypothetical protein [Candidatus Lokiarchaeota archaeon]